MNPQQILTKLEPGKKFFIGIDSDGCVFDTMEPKQKEFFCPNVIRYFGLLPVSRAARETWEFVNLYSKTRGVNRFIALVKAFDLLKERKDVNSRGFRVPELGPVQRWIEKETRLGNPALEEYAAGIRDPVIDLTLEWSKKVNEEIARWVHGISPFSFVRESLEMMQNKADTMVVSQTPLEALEREWEDHGIDRFVRMIAGQEYGTKTEHIALAAKGKYPDERILMIGDAPGDMKAARTNGVLFFPVNPGKEDESWERLYREGFERFLKGAYAGAYEEELIREFNACLPEFPNWDTIQSDNRS